VVLKNEAKADDLMVLENTDVLNSPYFMKVDVYNLKNTTTRVVLPKFSTRQQKTMYSCGPVCAMMVADYYLGSCPNDEISVCKIMGANSMIGIDIGGMKKYFDKLGWEVVDSRTKPAPKEIDGFKNWVKAYLDAGMPIIVENIELGGHWRVIIGYDSMGTDITADDVLFMADPYDSFDHRRDGYNVVSMEKFFYMWFDAKLFSQQDRERPYIVAKPK